MWMSKAEILRRQQDRRVLIASATAYAVACAASWMQPLLLVEILRFKGGTAASAGLVLTVEMLALSLSSIFYARVATGVSFTAIAIGGTTLAIIGNVLSLVAKDHVSLLATRILCGLGEGATLMVASAALARFDDPDRAYGKINAFSILTGSLLIYAAPFLGRWTIGPTTFPALLLFMLLLLPVLLIMPRGEHLRPALEDTPVTSRFNPRLLIIGLAVLIASVTNAAVWSFCFAFGSRAGLGAATLNTVMAIAILFALAGSVLAGAIGSRHGRTLPFAMGLTIVSFASFTLSHTTHPLSFEVAMAAYLTAMYFIIPYFFGYAAAEDPSGRGAAMIGAIFLLSFAIGPYLGGIISQQFGYRPMGWLVLIADSIAFLMLAALRLFPQHMLDNAP